MKTMKKYTIVAYPECDENILVRQEKDIYARNHAEAIRIAWRTFPEYHEVGAFEIEEKENNHVQNK